MQYNESLYNGDSYNLTNYTSTLVETIAPTDSGVAFSIGVVKTESQGTADAIGGSASLQAFLETITILQRAQTPFAYNNGTYNQYMYNARLDEDEILLMATKALMDSMTLTDFLQPFSIQKELLETISDIDTVTFMASSSLLDLVICDALAKVEISNKAVNETVRVADWLSIERRPANNEWGD